MIIPFIGLYGLYFISGNLEKTNTRDEQARQTNKHTHSTLI